MSARRRARAHPLLTTTGPGGIPAAFVVGRLIEVWAEPGAKNPAASAFRRFVTARSWWLDRAGVRRDRDELIPLGTLWSAEYLRDRGHDVEDRLARAGVAVDDLPALAMEADYLFRDACGRLG